MPKIDFCFSGWVRGCTVSVATDAEGKDVDVSQMDASELVDKLHNGELFISLADNLHNGKEEEIEIFDYEG